jgi:sugar phosphate isomerase/epimerase
MKKNNALPRRTFLKTACGAAGSLLAGGWVAQSCVARKAATTRVPVYAHLWVYASRFPPDWDSTPVLDEVFSDLKYAGYGGVEVMESVLKHEGAVDRLKRLMEQHRLPVSGTSYNAPMWDKSRQQATLNDIENVISRLQAVGGTTLGLTVGDAKRTKTEEELDTQAETLKGIMAICDRHGVVPNLHNHTFEVINDLHDLKGTMARVPDLKLGPDLNWLVRGGVDPVWFIKTYGHKMVYMHLRDQDVNGKWTEALGEGVTDFSSIAKALADINYKGKAAVELAFEAPPQRPVREDWKMSRDYVKQVFGW